MWPLWLRCQLAGLVWGGTMLALLTDGPHTALRAVAYLLAGVVFGLVLWAVLTGFVRAPSPRRGSGGRRRRPW